MTSQLEWDMRFLSMAALVASWSKDPSTKVGAVVTDFRNRVLSTGFNGLPRGTSDDPRILKDRGIKNSLVLHAEVNALTFAVVDLHGCTLYCTHPPCSSCSGLIVQHGIARVVVPGRGSVSLGFQDRWEENVRLARRIYRNQVKFEAVENFSSPDLHVSFG